MSKSWQQQGLSSVMIWYDLSALSKKNKKIFAYPKLLYNHTAGCWSAVKIVILLHM